MFQKLNAFFNPEQFQGKGKTRNYFEGWYFKLVNADETSAFAVIPGIAMDIEGKGHAFIQVLDGKKKSSKYHKFELDQFSAVPGKFNLIIENNSFSEEGLQLDLPGIKGSLKFSQNVPWPKPWYSPGIMGPYAFVPFMECYHGIVSMDHIIEGQLEIDGQTVSFDNGRGYIEKDWGRSFPSAYVWMQSNHFSKAGISFKASVARIPWIHNAFTGFIAGIWFNNELIRFTTYNKSSLRKCVISSSEVNIILENRKYHLEIIAPRDPSTPLASPISGAMDGKIDESMTSMIEIILTDNRSKVIVLKDTGRNACLEVAGEIATIEQA